MLQKLVQFRADFVLFSRWVTCIVLPIIALSLGCMNPLNELADGLFFVSTLIITLFPTKHRPRSGYLIVVLFDLALASLIVLASGGFDSDLYALYFWPIFEAAFLINWQTGLCSTFLADACYCFVVLSDAQRPGVSALLTRLAINTIVSVPLLYSSFLQKLSTQQASEQSKLLAEKEQLLQELETINQQMTEYTFSVQHLAVVDRLTDLFNQSYFHNRLMVEVEKARIDRYPVSLALFDIDNFKQFNDTHGHHCGDEVLCAVAQTLKNTISGTDFFAGRIGGEELVVVMPGLVETEALQVAEQIRKSVANLSVPLHDTTRIHVTVSGGVAAFPDFAADAPALTRAADQAMYNAKHSGKNQVIPYSKHHPDWTGALLG